jgi:SAM-dependent methyltransferase
MASTNITNFLKTTLRPILRNTFTRKKSVISSFCRRRRRRKLVKLASQSKVEAAKVVEVGTWLGKTAITMADAGAEVTCVDMWKDFGSSVDTLSSLYQAHGERIYNTFLSNIGTRKGVSIHPKRMSSLDAAKEQSEQVDLVFIDAKHDYAAVKEDIAAWILHVRPGGILCGHDYSPDFPGVVKAVNECLGEVNVEGAVWWKRMEPAPVNRLAPLNYPEFEEDVPEIIANGASH